MDVKKGDEVIVVSGEHTGISGTVFWVGPSKFDDGTRVGIKDAEDETYWVDADDLADFDSIETTDRAGSGDHLAGLKIVLTGDFSAYSRKEASRVLESLGADVTSAVSGKTKVLIVGEKPGASKLSKAADKGIPQIDESKMVRMIQGETLEQVLGGSASTDKTADAPTAKPVNSPAPSKHLEGLKIVLTGDFVSMSRQKATEQLEALGADVTSGVSGKTKLLIAGKKPGATKLNKAKKNGLPIFDEAQMSQLLAGTSLDQLIAAKEQEKRAVLDSLPPFLELPRDGKFQHFYTDSEQLHIEGEFRDGLRHGTWKMWWPNGQLKQEYEWEDGLQHGIEFDWAENGTQVCEGNNERGVRVGTWTWWHGNGQRSHGYTYENGKKVGEYLGTAEDGSLRAQGSFLDDKKHGRWEWHEPDKSKKRTVCHYRHNQLRGEERIWFDDQQLASERYFGPNLHGAEKLWYADGSPRFEGEWRFGRPTGLHKSWDEEGNLTETNHVDFLPESIRNDRQLAEKIVKKIKKAKGYRKLDAISAHVEHAMTDAYVAMLWRDGLYEVHEDPELWDTLAQRSGLLSGDELIRFLSKAKTRYTNEYGVTQDAIAEFLPYWPRALDRLTLGTFATDPEPVRSGWKNLPDKMKKGVAFVLARFGEDIGDVLEGEVSALVDRHVQNGLGDRIDIPIDGEPPAHGQQTEIYHGHPRQKEPNENFDLLLSFFGISRDAWKNELITRVPAAVAEGRFMFAVFYDAVLDADAESLAEMFCTTLEAPSIERVMMEWRDDTPEFCLDVVNAIPDDKPNSLRGAVAAAIVKFARAGLEVPEDLAMKLPLYSQSTTYSSAWYQPPHENATPAFIAKSIPIVPGTPRHQQSLYFEALNAIPPDVLKKMVKKESERQFGKSNAAAPLFRIDDEAIWERTVKLLKKESNGQTERHTMSFGEIGLPAIPLIEKASDKVKSKEKEAWWCAIIYALAIELERGTEIPDVYDRHLRVNGVKDRYYYQFMVPLLQRVIFRLPKERAERAVIAALDADFWRGIELVAWCPTEAVIHRAMPEFLKRESEMDYEYGSAVKQLFRCFLNTEDWARWIVQSGGGKTCRDALGDVVGWKRLEQIENEAKSGGVEQTKKMDAIDKVVQLTSNDGEELYFLRRDGDFNPDDLNVIGGAAPGVGKDRWPVYDDEPMAHLYTLDLPTMPFLHGRFSDYRTMSVFCHSPEYNEAWEPGNGQTHVVFSTQAQVDASVEPPEEIEQEFEARFEVVAAKLDMGDDDVRSRVYQTPARVCGDPIWLQSEDGWGDFVMQFDEGFVDINLGDSGIMYVYADDAFWQCH